MAQGLEFPVLPLKEVLDFFASPFVKCDKLFIRDCFPLDAQFDDGVFNLVSCLLGVILRLMLILCLVK